MQGMMCWIPNAGTAFHLVMQLQQTSLQMSLIGLCVHAGDWACLESSEWQSQSRVVDACCPVVLDWFPLLCQAQDQLGADDSPVNYQKYTPIITVYICKEIRLGTFNSVIIN